jgi:cysteine desulfurase
MAAEAAPLVPIRDRLIDAITAMIPNACLIGDRYRRLPGQLCLGLAGMGLSCVCPITHCGVAS